MIDTIVLLIPPQHFKIVKPQEFTPTTNLVYHGIVSKAVQNPTGKELKQGIYKPRLTLSRRMNINGISQIMLTIETSLPKLLFGNNFNELRSKDFQAIITTMHTKLTDMGVEISPEHLKFADVTTLHYSKNITLTDGSTPFHYIQKIKDCSMTARLDNNQTNYRNSGHSFKWHCNNYEVVFYDKIFDLFTCTTKGKKRSIDGFNSIDLNKIKNLRTNKKFEILRIEVRLNKRSVIKKLFAQLSVKNNLTLAKIFKPSLSRKVLLHYLNMLEQKRSSIIDFKPQSNQALLSTLIVYNPELKPKDILSCIGFKKLLETMSADEIKKLFKKQHNRSWNRMIQGFNAMLLPVTNSPFGIVRKQIKKYKALRLFPQY